MSLASSSFLFDITFSYISSILFLVGKLFDLCGQRGLHVVRFVLDVVVLQDRLHASALLIPALLGTRHCGRQALFGERPLLCWGQLARLEDLFYCVINRSPFLLAAFVLLVVVSVLVDLDA